MNCECNKDGQKRSSFYIQSYFIFEHKHTKTQRDRHRFRFFFLSFFSLCSKSHNTQRNEKNERQTEQKKKMWNWKLISLMHTQNNPTNFSLVTVNNIGYYLLPFRLFGRFYFLSVLPSIVLISMKIDAERNAEILIRYAILFHAILWSFVLVFLCFIFYFQSSLWVFCWLKIAIIDERMERNKTRCDASLVAINSNDFARNALLRLSKIQEKRKMFSIRRLIADKSPRHRSQSVLCGSKVEKWIGFERWSRIGLYACRTHFLTHEKYDH